MRVLVAILWPCLFVAGAVLLIAGWLDNSMEMKMGGILLMTIGIALPGND